MSRKKLMESLFNMDEHNRIEEIEATIKVIGQEGTLEEITCDGAYILGSKYHEDGIRNSGSCVGISTNTTRDILGHTASEFLKDKLAQGAENHTPLDRYEVHITAPEGDEDDVEELDVIIIVSFSLDIETGDIEYDVNLFGEYIPETLAVLKTNADRSRMHVDHGRGRDGAVDALASMFGDAFVEDIESPF